MTPTQTLVLKSWLLGFMGGVAACAIFVQVWCWFVAPLPANPSHALCMAYGEWVGQSGQHATAMERLCVEAGR